jgi:hypothetical protein
MNRALFPLLGLIAAAAIVGGGIYLNRGSHMVLRGGINKVRTHAVDDKSSVAVVDFRFTNPADYPFLVRTVQLFLDGQAGTEPLEGAIVADVDAKRVMEAIPELGPKYNDSLKVRDRLGPKTSNDRMIAARFEVPVTELNRRKQFRLRVEETDGAVTELIEAHGQTN